jgi:hypothetical protein
MRSPIPDSRATGRDSPRRAMIFAAAYNQFQFSMILLAAADEALCHEPYIDRNSFHIFGGVNVQNFGFRPV